VPPAPEEAAPVHKDTILRISWLTALALLAAALLIRFSVLLATPVAQLRNVVDFIYDDGYYYLAIAANLAQHGRSTLDGITATNGYQPAWLLALALLAEIVGTGTRTFFVASCTLVYAIACATPLLALLWRKSTSRTAALCLATGLAVVMIQEPIVFLEGLEPILFPAVMMAMVVLIERPILDRKCELQLSALLAAAFLVRLDALALYGTACICLPLFGATAEAPPGRSRLRQFRQLTLRLATFVVPTVVAYFAINQWLFGSAVPVSGRAKDVGGPFFSNWGISLAYTDHWRPIAVLVAILLLLEYLARRLVGRPQPVLYRSLAVFVSATVIQYLYYATLSTWLLWPWYIYLLAADIALLIARIVYLASLFDLGRRRSLIGGAALLLIGAWALRSAALFAFDSLPPATQWQLAFLRPLGFQPGQTPGTMTQEQANLVMLRSFFDSKPHSLVAMGDRSGGFAYWGRNQLSLIQTEGLTLGAGYLKAREAGVATAYLEHLPIDYYVIDREVVPTTQGPGGQRVFVVADPIQGRVSRSPVPIFCFPESAIRYESTYPSWRGISTRMAFQFSARVPCSAATLARMRSIETGMGLRQFSLPSEYHGAGVSPRIVSLEDRDRHFQDSDPADYGFGRFMDGRDIPPR
jgi:hypothetical protein